MMKVLEITPYSESFGLAPLKQAADILKAAHREAFNVTRRAEEEAKEVLVKTQEIARIKGLKEGFAMVFQTDLLKKEILFEITADITKIVEKLSTTVIKNALETESGTKAFLTKSVENLISELDTPSQTLSSNFTFLIPFGTQKEVESILAKLGKKISVEEHEKCGSQSVILQGPKGQSICELGTFHLSLIKHLQEELQKDISLQELVDSKFSYLTHKELNV